MNSQGTDLGTGKPANFACDEGFQRVQVGLAARCGIESDFGIDAIRGVGACTSALEGPFGGSLGAAGHRPRTRPTADQAQSVHRSASWERLCVRPAETGPRAYSGNSPRKERMRRKWSTSVGIGSSPSSKVTAWAKVLYPRATHNQSSAVIRPGLCGDRKEVRTVCTIERRLGTKLLF
jgi:hypothetical protein